MESFVAGFSLSVLEVPPRCGMHAYYVPFY